MRVLRMTVILMCLSLFAVCVASVASADERDQKTIVTFTEPVVISEHVLSPGTYVFKLLDSPSSRNIVQIFDEDMTHLYATIFSIPAHRSRPVDQATFRLERRISYVPRIVKTWFYAGRDSGHEFVTPDRRLMELAKAYMPPTPVISSETTTRSAETPTESQRTATQKPSREAAATATQETNEVAQPVVTSPSAPSAEPREEEQPENSQAPQVAQQPQSTEQPQEQTEKPAEQLPQTASSLPVVALLGLGVLGCGIILRFVSRGEA